MSASKDRSYRFENKVVLMAGSSNGIGRVTAGRFAAEGAKVAVVASSSIEKARTVAQEISQKGGIAEPFQTDISDVAAIEKLVSDVVSQFGTIDILVNTAGTHYATYVGETTEEEYDGLVDVNLKGAYFLMNAVAPIMKKQGAGKIVNVTAQFADIPMSTMGLYSASKAALKSLTAAMAWELGPFGINCNAVAPGNVITPEWGNLAENKEFADVFDWFKEATPSMRKVSTADDAAGLILFLASDQANSIFGETLVADEGMTRAWSGFLSNGVAIFPDKQGKRRTVKGGGSSGN